jgi:hypothetical protein
MRQRLAATVGDIEQPSGAHFLTFEERQGHWYQVEARDASFALLWAIDPATGPGDRPAVPSSSRPAGLATARRGIPPPAPPRDENMPLPDSGETP